jgi:CheY-like chemotaxis protein
MFREGLAMVLATQPDMNLVAQASNGREAIQQFREHRPDITLMDLQMPAMNGLESMAAIRKEFPEAKIIILTTYESDVEGAMKLALALTCSRTGWIRNSWGPYARSTRGIKRFPKQHLSPSRRYAHQAGSWITPHPELELFGVKWPGNAQTPVVPAVGQNFGFGEVARVHEKARRAERPAAAVLWFDENTLMIEGCFIMSPGRVLRIPIAGQEASLMDRIAITAALWLLVVPLYAQWLNLPTPGIPRTADGKPNLTAPAPRTADGKPDLSGMWRPEVNPYRFDVIQDLKDEGVFRPEAEAIFVKRLADFRRDDPVTNCLPGGPSEALNTTYRIVQSPTVLALLYESGTGRYRQIYLDGRKLPKDPNPTWLGYSVGHWEGDTLVVDSAGFNDRSWLDRAGHPHSESLRVTERFRRVDFGHMQFQITFDDPKTLTKPLSFSLAVNYSPDTDMLENVCNESDRNKVHMVATANTGIQLGSGVLAKYTGKYEFRDGSRTVAGFMGMTQNVTVMNGHLYLNALPLIPQSETRFESTGAVAEFLLDANGKVTRLVLGQTEGDAMYDRKP